MRNFLADFKKSKEGEAAEPTQPVTKSEPDLSPAPAKSKKPFQCLVTVECDIFDEPIAIIMGHGRFSRDEDGPGGTVEFFYTNKKIHFPGVIFFHDELAIFLERKLSEEEMLFMYETKKQFGSLSRIVEHKEEVINEDIKEAIADGRRRFQKIQRSKEER